MNGTAEQLQNEYQQAQGQAQSWVQSRIVSRFQQLESREQSLLLVAAVVLPLAILIFGILLPMQDNRKAIQKDLAQLQEQAETAEMLATQLVKSGTDKKAEQKMPLLAIVERLARQTKVREFMTRIRPQPSLDGAGQRLMLQLKNVPFEAMIRFMDALAHTNLGLSSMKIQAGKSVGLVHVKAIISSQ